MKRRLLVILALFCCTLAFSSCLEEHGGNETVPSNTDVTTSSNPNPSSSTAPASQSHTHNFGAWKVVVAATCLEKGKEERTCDCGEKETREIAAKGHTVVKDAAVAATCTKSGKKEGSHCSVCNAIIKAQETVPAKGHTVVNDAAVEPTCTKAGKTAGSHCSVCKEVLVKQETIPAKGHSEVIDAAVPATCTATGLTEGKHCSVCNATIKSQEIVPVKDHTIVIDAAIPATCTATGLTEGKHCSVCGQIIIAQSVVPTTEHDYLPATYSSPAKCSICGHTTGKPLPQPTIKITKGCSFPCYQGSIAITSAYWTTTYNGDGTYTVKITMTIKNQSSVTQICGAFPYLSGYETYDGTVATLSAYASGTCTATFHDIPGGEYVLYF